MPQDEKNLSTAQPEPANDRDFDPDGADGTLDIPNAPDVSAVQGDAERIAELETQVLELREQALRALAESENVRKRLQREIEDAHKFAVTRFARDILPVADNLGRALQALPEDRAGIDEKVLNVIAGVEATERELLAIFERNGLKKVEPMGEKFDPELHQAVMEVPTADHPPGTVVLVMQPGYVLKERLLRPAMVGVAKASE